MKYTKRINVKDGIKLIPSNINFILSDSLRILKLENGKKNKTIKLARINGELMVNPLELNKKLEQLLWVNIQK